jgi:hypothetical protein
MALLERLAVTDNQKLSFKKPITSGAAHRLWRDIWAATPSASRPELKLPPTYVSWRAKE